MMPLSSFSFWALHGPTSKTQENITSQQLTLGYSFLGQQGCLPFLDCWVGGMRYSVLRNLVQGLALGREKCVLLSVSYVYPSALSFPKTYSRNLKESLESFLEVVLLCPKQDVYIFQ